MAIIRNYNSRAKTTYVYESKGYYDRDAHKTKTKRTLIGKLDENGNVVPTGKIGRPPMKQADAVTQDTNHEEEAARYKDLYEQYRKDSELKEKRIQELMSEVAAERKARKECEKVLRKMMEIGNSYGQQ